MQIVHARHGLAIESNDHITLAQYCLLPRAAGSHGNHDHARFLWQGIETNQAPMQRRGLGLDSNIAAPNSAFLQQTSSHKLSGIDPNSEAQSVRAHDGPRVHADDLAVGSHQGSAGIARIERGVSLDYIINHSSR